MSDVGEVSKELEARQVTDPVWLMTDYKPQPFKLEEAIKFHMELAQDTMLNNMNGFLFARVLLDMSTKKKVMGHVSGGKRYHDSLVSYSVLEQIPRHVQRARLFQQFL